MHPDYAALLRFARTEKQKKAITLLRDFVVTRTKGNGDGRVMAVAKTLGITHSSLGDLVEAVQKHAARAGYAPENRPPWSQTVPDGHEVKGMSTLVNADGVLEHQWQKTQREPDPTAMAPAVPEGHHVTATSTMIDREGRPVIQWLRAEHAAAERENAFLEHARAAVAEFTPLPAITQAPGEFKKSLTGYYLGDPHIGMLSWSPETGVDFDSKIAQAQLLSCVDDLVSQAPPSEDAHLVNIGDARHAEDDRQVTPKSANKLDVDTRSGRVLRIWLDLMLHMTARCLQKHKRVRVFNVPGNHDPQTAVLTQLWLEQAFQREPRVIVNDSNNPYQYHQYGKVLLGYCHGDGAKDGDLLPLMSVDCAPGGIPGFENAWGSTFYRHWFRGHHHNDGVSEFRGGMVERIRTLAPRDLYTHKAGYRSGQSLKAVTFDPEYGERSRVVCDIRRVRNRLEG
jgi:hypothetical protein